MSIQARLEALKDRHHELESKLHSEETRPAPDIETVAALKRQKLAIKDEMLRLSG